MKKFDLLFTAILVPLDYIMLVLAGLAVYFLRFRTLAELRPVVFELPFLQYLKIILVVSFFWLLIFVLNGLYQIGRQRFSQELIKIFASVTTGIMLIVLFIFFIRELFSSRFIVLVGWLLAIIFVSFGRLIIHLAHLYSFKRGLGLEGVLIVGSGPLVEMLIKNIEKDKGLGYRIVGHAQTIEEVINQWQDRAGEISIIINADLNSIKDGVYKLAGFCNEHQIVFKYAVDSFGALLTNVKTETFIGIPLVEIKRTNLDGWGRILKRIFDLIISFSYLILFLPLFFVVAILIKIDSRGPILISLNRVGQRGKNFKLYKFRSMVENAHQIKAQLLKYSEREGPLFKMKNDPRITKIGRWLRKWSIDELPQLINVLKGEMSLVGPRPHEPEEVAQYQKQHKQLLTIKPGITGLAQISGRSELPFDEEAKLDIYYIENWSLGLDLQILIKTIPVVLGRKSVA